MSTIAIEKLSPSEKLALIGELWDSLDQIDVPVTAAQREELDRRLADLGSDMQRGSTWAEFKQEMQRHQR